MGVGRASCRPPLWGKWVTFAASCIIQACAGLAYSFSIYAPALKERLGLTQVQVATAGSAVNFGGYFAIISGSVYDATQDQHAQGPRLVVWLGCLCCFCGYLGLWMLTSGRAAAGFAEMLLFAVCAGNAGTWLDTATIVTNVRNFPNSRGFVVGILKSFAGLSASIYTTIYVAAFAPNAVDYILVLSVVPSLICGVLGLLVNHVPFVEACELPHGPNSPGPITSERRFVSAFCLVGLIAAYQCLGLFVSVMSPSPAVRTWLAVGCLCLVSLVALVLLRTGGLRAVYGRDNLGERSSTSDSDDATSDKAAAAPGPAGGRAGGGGGARGWERPASAGVGGGSYPPTGPTTAAAAVPANGTGVARSASGDGRSLELMPLLPPAAPSLAPASSSRAKQRASAASSGSASVRSPPTPAAARRTAQRRPAGSAGALADCGTDDDSDGGGGGDGGMAPGGEGAPVLSGAGCAGGKGSEHEQLLQNMTPGRMLRTFEFWCLFFQFTVGPGVSLALLNNLGQMVVALGGRRGSQVTLVSVFSISNAAGRLLMGYLPEKFFHLYGAPRMAFLAGVSAASSATALATAYCSLDRLPLVTLLLGLCFGSHWSLMPAVCSDLFGLSHFGSNYTTLQFAPAIGSYLMATLLTGRMYDRAASAHGTPRECAGQDCFSGAFLSLAALAALSAAACTAAAARSAGVYKRMLQHMKQVEAMQNPD